MDESSSTIYLNRSILAALLRGELDGCHYAALGVGGRRWTEIRLDDSPPEGSWPIAAVQPAGHDTIHITLGHPTNARADQAQPVAVRVMLDDRELPAILTTEPRASLSAAQIAAIRLLIRDELRAWLAMMRAGLTGPPAAAAPSAHQETGSDHTADTSAQ